MRIRRLYLLARVGLFALVWASLSGCFLRLALGNVEYVGSIHDEVHDYIHKVFSDATGGTCTSFASPPFTRSIECNYVIDGEPISSTAGLVSQFGLFGLFVYPLILEVPQDVISVTATYDEGGGPQPLPVGRGGSFQVHPGLWITAEVGTTFLFLDLPSGADQSADLSFSLSYHRLLPPGPPPPATIKPMLAGLVIVRHQKYYIPLLPCVTDFAEVPAVTLPQSDTPQNLEMTLGDFIRNEDAKPCDHVVHDFSGALPPPGLVFMPLVQR